MKFTSVLKNISFWILLSVVHIIILMAVNALVPLSEALRTLTQQEMKLSMTVLPLVAAINSAILLYTVKRSSWNGLRLIVGMTIVVFGLMTFMTQIETAFFMSAFPKLTLTELLKFFLRGFISAAIFVPVTVLVSGKIKGDKASTGFSFLLTKKLFWQLPVLAFSYAVLYFLAGYYIAWQFETVRMFYAGKTEIIPVVTHYVREFSRQPLFVPFQLLRGILWTAFGLPLILMYRDKRAEGLVLSFLLFALLPVTQLLYPNTLMPEAVRMAHFIEVSISTGLFGIVSYLVLVPAKR